MNKIKRIWINWLIKIQRNARRKSLKQAIEKAKEITLETDKKVLIYFVHGEYVVMTKQEMKAMWKNKHFIGYSLQEVEKFAEVKIESYDKSNRQEARTATR